MTPTRRHTIIHAVITAVALVTYVLVMVAVGADK